MKICTKCKEPKPESEYYQYRRKGNGTLKFTQCKTCIQTMQQSRHKLGEMQESAAVIARLRSIDKTQRANSLFAMVENGNVSKVEFRTVLRSVEF